MKVDKVGQLITRIASVNANDDAKVGKCHVAPLLIGEMGLGKSWVVKAAADDLKINFIDLRLAQQEPSDLVGMPKRTETKTIWLQPEWWPSKEVTKEVNTVKDLSTAVENVVNSGGEKGILFLDEINRAPVEVLQAVFQLVLDRKIHTHVLPAGWTVVAAMNPNTGAYQVNELDPALQRRFLCIKFEGDDESWMKWAFKYGIDTRITQFISRYKEMLFKEKDFKLETTYSPDQWRMVDSLIKANVISCSAKDPFEFECLVGLLGPEAATVFQKFLDSGLKDLVSAEDILDKYGDDIKKKLAKQETDEMYATVSHLIGYIGDDGTKLSQKQVKNMAAFMKDTKDEIKIAIIKKLPPKVQTMLTSDKDLVDDVKKIAKELTIGE